MLNSVDGPDRRSALEAKTLAQWIAFGPFVFQATMVLQDTGLLRAISDAGPEGIDTAALCELSGVSAYGVGVLLDFALSIGLIWRNGDRHVLDKTGHFVVNDEMTRVNLNFTRDVCYHSLAFLGDSIRDGKPHGLKVHGDWGSLYEGLTVMPKAASESWFRFDHYYSDRVFEEFLPIVFATPVTEILDIGANTGRLALRCLDHDPDVRVTLMDLPVQLTVAGRNIREAGHAARLREYPIDVLDETREFYRGADVICMSQFLDCFSEPEIAVILRRVVAVMHENTRLYIMELFWDRQKYPAAAFSLNATSLYFTCIANGKSRMYHSSDLMQLVNEAGLEIVQDIDDVGVGHTIFECRKARRYD